jgi:hypothetical protein
MLLPTSYLIRASVQKSFGNRRHSTRSFRSYRASSSYSGSPHDRVARQIRSHGVPWLAPVISEGCQGLGRIDESDIARSTAGRYGSLLIGQRPERQRSSDPHYGGVASAVSSIKMLMSLPWGSRI